MEATRAQPPGCLPCPAMGPPPHAFPEISGGSKAQCFARGALPAGQSAMNRAELKRISRGLPGKKERFRHRFPQAPGKSLAARLGKTIGAAAKRIGGPIVHI